MSGVDLSILELGLVSPGQDAAPALRHLVSSAPEVEQLGYRRFWLAEHHEQHFSYATPEILVASIAAVTKRIRVGAAGMLMHFLSPLRVAETFRALEALHPGRVDLGLASGLTGCPEVRRQLREGFDLDEARKSMLYGRNAELTIRYCRNEIAFDHKSYAGPTPVGQRSPPVIMLGGGHGRGNMLLAAKHGTAFCYSLAHGNSDPGPENIREYRRTFQPAGELNAPDAMIAASCICMESDSEAVGELAALRSFEPGISVSILGSPDRCRRRIHDLLEKYDCREMVLIPLYRNTANRDLGLRLVAKACLSGTATASA